MKDWRKWKVDLRWVVIVVLVFLVGWLGWVNMKLAVRRPAEPVLVGVDEQVDRGCEMKSGLVRRRVEEGVLVVKPSCLTVMNGKWGSRFNLDTYLGENKLMSSGLGNLVDRELGLGILVDGVEVWPVRVNSEFGEVEVELGLTYEEIRFGGEKGVVTVRIESVFDKSSGFEDEAAKLASAPFVYLRVSYEGEGEGVVRVEKTGKAEYKKQDGVEWWEWSDPVRKNGVMGLASVGGNEVAKLEAGVGFESGSGRLDLVLGGYVDGAVVFDSSDPEAYKRYWFAYTKWFEGLGEVLEFAVENEERLDEVRNGFELEMRVRVGGVEKYWIMAQAFHSYMGNTMLVVPEKGEGWEYLVWEGEFGYINTVDVAHDYGVLEGMVVPWVLESELRLWKRAAMEDEYGWVVPHDLGKGFDLALRQDYGTQGMFPSAMPVEENANYLLLSYWYWHRTGDVDWVRENWGFMMKLYESLEARDTNENGLADVGVGITTYDIESNPTLYKAPDNLYLGVKQVVAYTGLVEMLGVVGQESKAREVETQAKVIVGSLERTRAEWGRLPLSLSTEFVEAEGIRGNEELGYPVIVGLLYADLTEMKGEVVERLETLLGQVYPSIWEVSWRENGDGMRGMVLAEHQRDGLGWLSHELIAGYVAEKSWGLDDEMAELILPWLVDSPMGYVDGFVVKEGVRVMPFLGFYPRGGVSFVWVGEE